MEIQISSLEEMRKYLEFLLWHYRLVDALWFLKVEERFGTSEAVRMNEEIWSKIGEIAARDLKKYFNIGRGLKEFERAFRLYPWNIIISPEIVVEEDRMMFKVPHCPPQEARVKHGLGEFPCKTMHVKELTNFARVIDPNLKVICKYAPPDPHPENIWCEWEIKTTKNSEEV
ncbi:MAG: hypothetical protein DRO52_05630 [Candidatus Hecatellales archaeon]|nr:MAG: hypothetical protein DRO52_05630 [Candidatus Hecatellales archaeon]